MTDQRQVAERAASLARLCDRFRWVTREQLASSILAGVWVAMILFWLVQALGEWAAWVGGIGFMYLGAPLVLVSLWLERSWPLVAAALPVLGLYAFFWIWRLSSA